MFIRILIIGLLGFHANVFAQGSCAVSGTIVDTQGNAIADAQVFLEEGLGGPIYSTRSDASGRFSLSEIGTGASGLFAFKQGYAFGGDTITLALGDHLDTMQITLRTPVSMQGRVQNDQKDAIAGARVDRVAILGGTKFSVPLSQLGQAGISTPLSDSSGRFTIPHLPQATDVALKIIHPSYAQEAIAGLSSNDNAEVTLYSGVLVRGEVLTRAENKLVAGAAIELRNAQPPHDTSSTTTDAQGGFQLRVKPGVYAYRATGSGYRSPAWQRITVTGDQSSEWIRLIVSRLGRIQGEVKDAASGQPLSGVRIHMISGGDLAGVIRTGALGTFDVEAASGLVDVKYEAPEGYRAPDRRAMRLTVAEDEVLKLPTVWMAPIAPASAVINGVDGVPASGNLVRIIRPQQFDWNVTASDGSVGFALSAIPDEGSVLAIAQHPTENATALFTVGVGGEASRAQLLTNGAISGRVTNDRGKDVEGAVVTIFYAEEAAGEPAALWQGRTDGDGMFAWNSALARVPLRVVAHVPDETGTPIADQSGESSIAVVESAGRFDVGNIVIASAKKSESALGSRMRLDKAEVRCGAPVPENVPVIAVVAPAGEQQIVDALGRLSNIARRRGVYVVALANWEASCPDADLSILNLAPDGYAKTFAINADGRVVAESMSFPTYDAVRMLGR